jgi:hypothetical protein
MILLSEIKWGDMDWIGMAQNRDLWGGGAIVNAVMNLRVP